LIFEGGVQGSRNEVRSSFGIARLCRMLRVDAMIRVSFSASTSMFSNWLKTELSNMQGVSGRRLDGNAPKRMAVDGWVQFWTWHVTNSPGTYLGHLQVMNTRTGGLFRIIIKLWRKD